MVFSIKKQLSGYQSWLNLAETIELTELKALNRYDFVTFTFVFFSILFITLMVSGYNPLFSLFALVMHLYLGINLLKARTVVVEALDALFNYTKLNTNVAKYLNREYSLFLVAQGKKPLSEEAIENLEIHTRKFVEGEMTRGGRADSIRRFRIHFLKRERTFFHMLYSALIVIELFVIL
jgi:hypothetical protein